MKLPFYLIAAIDEARGIGVKNRLPWRISEDLQFFNKVTTGEHAPGVKPMKKNVVIMGKSTWESLPKKSRPLPGRTNIVLTRDPLYKAEGAETAGSLDAALTRAENHKPEQIFIIGGAMVFTEAIAHDACDGMYITCVSGTHGCDTFFPKIDEAIYEKVFESKPRTVNGETFQFTKYLRRESRQ